MRFIESDENLTLRGAALEEAIKDDIKLGLIPFWVSFGTKIYVHSRLHLEIATFDLERYFLHVQCPPPFS